MLLKWVKLELKTAMGLATWKSLAHLLGILVVCSDQSLSGLGPERMKKEQMESENGPISGRNIWSREIFLFLIRRYACLYAHGHELKEKEKVMMPRSKDHCCSNVLE